METNKNRQHARIEKYIKLEVQEMVQTAHSQHVMKDTGDKPHICRYCDKCFSSTGNKNQHEMTHTGDKPCRCKYCDNPYQNSKPEFSLNLA
jgi:uncharacterized Zn-finger protein